MTSRLIEKCFECEEYEILDTPSTMYLINLSEIENHLLDIYTPGKVIRIKHKNSIHSFNCRRLTYDN
jgi:hypothetical protein